MHPLMIVQQIDESHWLRGFIVKWVRALAARVDRLDVIALEWNPATELPGNVTVQSMGKERGANHLQELRAFHKAITRVIRDVDVIFSHMTPRYVWVAAPYALRRRKPQILWYTHRQVGWELRLALALSARVVTAAPDSFPLPDPKVTAIGHGIDARLFCPADSPTEPDTPEVVMVARLSPIKHHLTLIEAAARLRDQYGMADIRFVAVGDEPAHHPGHRARLEAEVARRGLADRFEFTGSVPQEYVPAIYRQTTVALNLSPPGSFDKAVLEAMLCAKPVVAAARAFGDLFGPHAGELLIDGPEDAAGLAERLAALLRAAPERRAQIGADLYGAAYRAHSLEALADRLVSVFEEVSKRRA
ncbi:MAG: glycosyltransferase family 4 protein [Anaerolineae bacterium]|nr:glycosyltransferase family 4 protein [Anaerolineae bacterium]